MTDAEVWGEIAAHIEASGVLPSYCECEVIGLCECLAEAYDAGVMSAEQLGKLQQQLTAKYNGHIGWWGLYWPEDDIQSRLRACRVLRRESLRKQGDEDE